VFFLEANSWQFLHLAQGAKSRDAREVRGRCVFTIPCKLACEGIWKRSAAWLAQVPPCASALSVPIRVIRGSMLSAPNPVKQFWKNIVKPTIQKKTECRALYSKLEEKRVFIAE
jgi:hypothetical protein